MGAAAAAWGSAMTIILHIGFPKTGSSALQYGFERNRDALARAGIHYAAGPVSALAAAGGITSGNGGALARYLVPRKRPDDYDTGAFEAEFARTYLDPARPVGLISSEALSAADPQMLARFVDAVAGSRPVLVVAFVRDLYGHARSAWMQGIKRHASDRGFAAFAERIDRAPQIAQLRTFEAVLGRERIRLLHYESERNDLFGALLRAAGLAVPDLDPSLPAINRSLSGVEVEVLRACNAIHRDPALSRRVSDHLIERYPDRDSAAAVDPAVLALLEARCAEDVAWTNATFFGGGPVLKVAPAARSGDGAALLDAADVWRDVVEVLIEEIRAAKLPSARPGGGPRTEASGPAAPGAATRPPGARLGRLLRSLRGG